MKICERCAKEFLRSDNEIVVYPNLCKDCEINILDTQLEE